MNTGHKWLRRGILLAVFLAPLAPAPPAMESSGPDEQVRTDPVPFRAGETLDYRVAWSAFSSAASLELSVPERRDLFGRETWHLRASAHTTNTVRALFTIDDQSDSYSDIATFESRQYEIHLNELGRKQDEILHFAPTGKASRAPGPVVAVPPGTYDPLGALYALRGVDWRRTQEFRIPVCDGHDVYEISARLDASGETVAVDAGNFTANRISIHVYQRGKEVPGNSYEVWLADDPARTPVRMQAELPFGSLRAELTSVTQ
ncbi:MAG: DUF3108 domain-containing protein [Candidatus Acidiferrales bacterium]